MSRQRRPHRLRLIIPQRYGAAEAAERYRRSVERWLPFCTVDRGMSTFLRALHATAPAVVKDLLAAIHGIDDATELGDLAGRWAERHGFFDIDADVDFLRVRSMGLAILAFCFELTGRVMPELPHVRPRLSLKALCAPPNPERESRAEWLDRANDWYGWLLYERERTTADVGRTFYRHCTWFVRVQVLRESPAAVARRDGVDRKAVDRATAAVATRLRVSRRRLPRGGARM